MSAVTNVPLYEMFPSCAGLDIAGLSGAAVVSARVDRAKLTMNIELALREPVAPVDLEAVSNLIAEEYGLSSVSIVPLHLRAAPSVKKAEDKKPRTGVVIMGKAVKQNAELTPIEKLSLELGKVTVTGEVFNVASRFIERSGAWVLEFDLTDYTGTVRVSKYLTDPNAKGIAEAIKTGVRLTVSGTMKLSRFDSELTLEPVSIVTAEEKAVREDKAEKKRVELHLHTKMSALDATTDVSDVIMRAVEWGHPAIAITDHGVVHAFPDAMKAAGDRIKVIYGLEGYYINDIDGANAVTGAAEGAVDGDLVVFDIETTGLNSFTDSILEIGAVRLKGGVETARFSTFSDPGAPVPQHITNLTGISDSDVRGAPSQRDAIAAFLAFADGAVLVAHNADFDAGFIFEACKRYGLEYEPVYIDTLTMARTLLPGLKNHKLDTVAGYYGKSGFKHHRAADDALVTAHIYTKMLGELKKSGVTDIAQINDMLSQIRAGQGVKDTRKGRIKARHIILLTKNQTGIRNLYKLVTKSHLEHFDRYPIITKSLLSEHRDGLIVGSACEAGEIFSMIVDGRGGPALRNRARFYDYLEIQPVCNNMFMLGRESMRITDVEQLRDLNRRVVELGRELNIPVAATGDTHFLDPEHEIFRRILLTSKGFQNADDELPLYFKTTDEMLEEFSYLGEEKAYEVVVTNTHAVAEMCEKVRPLPPAKTLYAPRLDGSAEELKRLVYEKLREMYGENPPETVTRRVETELSDILERNYDVIYMTAQKLVAASGKNGYLVGSRGSVGSSIVAYLAGITEVNSLPAHYRCPDCQNSDFESGQGWGCGADMPDKNCPKCGGQYVKDGFNIPFETFLGFGGDKVPDIDLNFSGEYQSRAHKHTNELFGAEHVFRAGTIGTIAERTAYGYVKKYLEAVGRTASRAEENRLAQGCVGVKRTTGQHPGGLIVIPQDMEITDFCPVQRPADSGDTDIVTTHFDYHCMEDNLLKLDELGHDDPTMIKMLEDLTGTNAQAIRLDDPETMAIFKSPVPLGLSEEDDIIGPTGTIGIPEFGTGFTRQMLHDTQPGDFDTLVRLSGYSHGTDVWVGNAKELIVSGKASVSETISCRDDIMLYLISMGMDDRAAFKVSENVRKGKGVPDGAEAELRKHGVPEWYIESCNKIKYLFPRAHAVAYVMMAFRIAWFKVHKPLEFYSAYFYRRSQKDSFDAELMTREVDFLRVKIRELKNNSDLKAKDEDLLTTMEACYEFYIRGFEFTGIDLYESDPVKFLIADGGKKLRPPFVAIRGLGETAAFDLATARESREFVSIDDLSASCPKVSKTHIEQLKALGALRGMPETSQMSLF